MALLGAASSSSPLMVPGLSGTRSPSCSRGGSTGSRSASVSESSSPLEARSPSCSRGGSTGRSSSVSVSSSPLDSWSSCSLLPCSQAGSSSSSSPLMAASGSRLSPSLLAPSSSALGSALIGLPLVLMIVNSTPLKRFLNRLLSSIARVGLVMLIYRKEQDVYTPSREGKICEKDTKNTSGRCERMYILPLLHE